MRTACLVLTLWAGVARADNPVASTGPLSDDDFYRVVACGAPPGGACQLPFVRWPDDRVADLTISVNQIAPDFPDDQQQVLMTELKAAAAQINAAGAALQLRFVPMGEAADITVHLLDIGMGEQIAGTGMSPPDGTHIEAALTQLFWNGNNNLTRTTIIFPRDIHLNDIASIALEELTQSLGLATDIDDPYYETRSIFSETSNSRTVLGEQDIMALRRHYPITKKRQLAGAMQYDPDTAR